MKKGGVISVIIVLSLCLLLSFSFVSASWLGDIWNNISGKNKITGYAGCCVWSEFSYGPWANVGTCGQFQTCKQRQSRTGGSSGSGCCLGMGQTAVQDQYLDCCSYSWQTDANWGSCPASCVTGTQTRIVTCKRSDGTLVGESYCGSGKPTTSQSCTDDRACTYLWTYGEWSTICSNTCGAGTQTRTATCKRSDGTIMTGTDANLCGTPETSKDCTGTSSCVYNWIYGSFGECSNTCGAGTKTKTAICKRSDGTTVADSFCGTPETSQDCEDYVGCRYYWNYSSWNECSNTCGAGTKTRTAECYRNNEISPDQTLCNEAEKIVEENCSNYNQCTYSWQETQWTPEFCNNQCGQELTQTRTVLCLTQNSEIVADENCTGIKPASTNICDKYNSCRFSWNYSEYGECHCDQKSSGCGNNCGPGIQMRTASCRASNGDIVEDLRCSDNDKDSLQKSCEILSGCTYSWQEGEWGVCSADIEQTEQAGIISRDVKCIKQQFGEIVDSSFCSSLEKPISEKACCSSNSALCYINSCMALEQSNKEYIFNDSINSSKNCIEIVGDNIILDGNSKILSGEDSSTGIIVNGTNVVIKNLEIRNFSMGIDLQSVGLLNIEDINFNNNDKAVSNNIASSSMIVKKNIFISNNFGINSETLLNSVFEENVFENNNYGIHILNSNFNSFLNNSFIHNLNGLSLIYSTYDSINNNDFISNQGGIFSGMSTMTNILSNVFEMNEKALSFIGPSSADTVTYNNFTNNSIGFEGKYSSGFNIVLNNFNLNGNALSFSDSFSNTIQNNDFSSNNKGAELIASNSNNINYNTFNANIYSAISILPSVEYWRSPSSSNIISNNILKSNYENGIYSESSNSNRIESNTIEGSNNGINIQLGCSAETITSNNITLNKIGINVGSVQGMNVFKNDISNNQIGILSSSSSYALSVSENFIHENNEAINLSGGSNNELVYNNITNNSVGVQVSGYRLDSLVSNNYFSENNRGVIVTGDNLKVLNNTMNNNEESISVSTSSSIISNNVINSGSSGIIFNGNGWFNTIESNNISNVGKGILINQLGQSFFINNYLVNNVVSIEDNSVSSPDPNIYNSLIYNNSYGEIIWTNESFRRNMTVRGNMNESTISISEELVYVDSKVIPRLNSTALVTFNNVVVPAGMNIENIIIYKDGVIDDSSRAISLVPFTIEVKGFSNYTFSTCGDGRVTGGEKCDNPDRDFCTSKCEETYCGDEIIQSKKGEECDNGPLSAVFPDYFIDFDPTCNSGCQLPCTGFGRIANKGGHWPEKCGCMYQDEEGHKLLEVPYPDGIEIDGYPTFCVKSGCVPKPFNEIRDFNELLERNPELKRWYNRMGQYEEKIPYVGSILYPRDSFLITTESEIILNVMMRGYGVLDERFTKLAFPPKLIDKYWSVYGSAWAYTDDAHPNWINMNGLSDEEFKEVHIECIPYNLDHTVVGIATLMGHSAFIMDLLDRRSEYLSHIPGTDSEWFQTYITITGPKDQIQNRLGNSLGENLNPSRSLNMMESYYSQPLTQYFQRFLLQALRETQNS